jgi:uncharacterized protein (UPF0210 family)
VAGDDNKIPSSGAGWAARRMAVCAGIWLVALGGAPRRAESQNQLQVSSQAQGQSKTQGAAPGVASAPAPAGTPVPGGTTRPRIRALTAFVKLDELGYQKQVMQAVTFLRSAEQTFEKAGFQVDSMRITTQAFPEYTGVLTGQLKMDFFKDLDKLAGIEKVQVSVGPAMSSDQDDPREAQLLARAIAATENLSGNVIIAQGDEVYGRALAAASGVIEYLAGHTTHSEGNFRFAALALVKPGTPFSPGSYYNGVGNRFAIGLESAGVVGNAIRGTHNFTEARKAIEKNLGEDVSEADQAGRAIAKENPDWIWTGIDLSPAPRGDVSIGAAIENFTGAPIGSSGTLMAAEAIAQALRAIPVAHVGYSGLMLPVLEDKVLAERFGEGELRLDGLLAFCSVSGTGLDAVPLPGDVTRDQLERMLGDVATLAIRLNRPLSVRLLPVEGKKAGERTEFAEPNLFNTVLQQVP